MLGLDMLRALSFSLSIILILSLSRFSDRWPFFQSKFELLIRNRTIRMTSYYVTAGTSDTGVGNSFHSRIHLRQRVRLVPKFAF